LYRECLAGAQIIFPESGRGLGHVTPTIFGLRSAILATAWLLVLIEINNMHRTRHILPIPRPMQDLYLAPVRTADGAVFRDIGQLVLKISAGRFGRE